MNSLLVEPLQVRLKLTLDWARAIEQAYLHASKSEGQLNQQSSEIVMGIRGQIKLLVDLLDRISSVDSSPSKGKISEDKIFETLCDAYSLYPPNHQIVGLLRYIWTFQNRESFLRLANDANRRILFVHISCQKRIQKAVASLESFGRPHCDEAHLIVVGSQSHQQPGLSFDYQNDILTIPVSDWYESHYQKTLYTFALLSTLLNYERLFKLDDDVTMLDRDTLNNAIAKLDAARIDYAGSKATSTGRHSEYNGWHINKCHDKSFERRGISHFASARFAMGGMGYQLSHRSTRMIRSSFLTNPMLYEKPRYALMEDEMLGLILESENIFCQNMPTSQLGLQTEGHHSEGSRKILVHQNS